ncbi:hypothetical protein ES288_A09G278600v1 [Gossypium darwinii]|uniref:Uncharacterized protein n=1 Tax=Gossypium darwinii TaxID=34276 RepID=A0A5D2FG07_GOSDA|nr:hypothetical protein ES288_A09G278600v1 [Gossypium darwinii]TYH04183.1 hypothetical protein ES288_A09G278600v1 [Gossypium darwinii]TYH04186.1 hypothetical protein ES288_A09G278600v1 [Gossypium darwinii]
MPGPPLEMEPVEPQSLKKLSLKSLKRALDLFSPSHGQFAAPDSESKKIRLSHKINVEYSGIKTAPGQPLKQVNSCVADDKCRVSAPSNALALTGPADSCDSQKEGTQNALLVGPSLQPKTQNIVGTSGKGTAMVSASAPFSERLTTSAIIERIPSKWPRPVWHRPWKNYRVISGHLGWVRSVAFDPSNNWFCTGSADRTIKIWDVASGRLKLTLTGHIEQIRGLAVSSKLTYMFSAGDDKQVKCWDLEQNKVIRSYHGHLSGVYCLALHPTIDILLTGGRDSVCRVWDIRTKMQIFALSGHDNTVCSVFTRPTDPEVVTGSHDTTIKFWDLRYGKTMSTLTHHKKSVRAMAPHPKEHSFASASADNIKKFSLSKGEFLHNMLSQQKTIINTMAVNEDGVMATGGDNGSLWFWDWRSGHNFQQAHTIVQPGSLDSEAGIYALSYDVTGTRLVSCEADKTIKMWKEDETATEQTHPLNFKPPKDIRRF